MTALATVPRETTEAEGNLVLQIPIDQIDVGDNVRVNVDGIDELAASIKEHEEADVERLTGWHNPAPEHRA